MGKKELLHTYTGQLLHTSWHITIEMQNPNIDITMCLQNEEPFLSPKVVRNSNFWKEKENPWHY
jgi:hypothetical protein